MVSSKPEFRKWCKDNPDRRIKLGIPTDPDWVYKNQGWKTWPIFLGTKLFFHSSFTMNVTTLFKQCLVSALIMISMNGVQPIQNNGKISEFHPIQLNIMKIRVGKLGQFSCEQNRPFTMNVTTLFKRCLVSALIIISVNGVQPIQKNGKISEFLPILIKIIMVLAGLTGIVLLTSQSLYRY